MIKSNFDSSQLTQQAIVSKTPGEELYKSGSLNTLDVENVVMAQRRLNSDFGVAAMDLGLLDEEQVHKATAQQILYPYLSPDDDRISKELVSAFQPFGGAVISLRNLRAQLYLRWLSFQSVQRAISLNSPMEGDGKTSIAANLAVVCSQMGDRTLLIDADLRNPRIKDLFKLKNVLGLSDILDEKADINVIENVSALKSLDVISAGTHYLNSSELLARANFTRLLENVNSSYDIVIIDTTEDKTSDDGRVVASHAGAALVIARAHRTPAVRAKTLTSALHKRGVSIVGAFLNEA